MPQKLLLQGEEQEAQALFNQVAELRAQELQQQAAELAEHAVQQAEQASTQNAITSSATSYNGTAPSQPSISSAAAAAAPAEPSTPTAAAAPADGDDDASDDWESCFDTGKIEQQLESHLVAAASKQQEAGSDDEGSSSSSRKNFRGRGETHWRRPAREGCEHVVEVYGLSKQHKTTHLEEFLLQHQVRTSYAQFRSTRPVATGLAPQHCIACSFTCLKYDCSSFYLSIACTGKATHIYLKHATSQADSDAQASPAGCQTAWPGLLQQAMLPPCMYSTCVCTSATDMALRTTSCCIA
jgi:hypothetical protein